MEIQDVSIRPALINQRPAQSGAQCEKLRAHRAHRLDNEKLVIEGSRPRRHAGTRSTGLSAQRCTDLRLGWINSSSSIRGGWSLRSLNLVCPPRRRRRHVDSPPPPLSPLPATAATTHAAILGTMHVVSSFHVSQARGDDYTLG